MPQKYCCCFPALSTTGIRSTPWAASDMFAHSIPLCRQTGSMGNQQIKNTGDKPRWKQRSSSPGFLYRSDWSMEVAGFPISAHFALMHILPTQPGLILPARSGLLSNRRLLRANPSPAKPPRASLQCCPKLHPSFQHLGTSSCFISVCQKKNLFANREDKIGFPIKSLVLGWLITISYRWDYSPEVDLGVEEA